MIFEFNVSKPAEVAYEYLSDMQKFVSVHPIIYKIDDLGENKFLVFERLKILFIPWNFTYVVNVETSKENKQVTITTTVKKMVHIKMSFIVEENSGSCKIKETVTFRSYLPVTAIMSKIFSDQHKQLFLNIGNV